MKKIILILSCLFLYVYSFSQAGKILKIIKLDSKNSSYINTNFKDFYKIGFSIENIGDLDGDGINDIAVGARRLNGGVVLIWFLNKDGSIKKHSIIGKKEGGLDKNIPNGMSYFGASITNLGDLDGDGINDLVVGSNGKYFGGEIFILYMKKDGTVKNHKRIGSNRNGFNISLGEKNNFGISVENIGDIDGDGNIDIAVGDDSDGVKDIGRIYILFLNANQSVKDIQIISDKKGGFVGDLNHDSRFGRSISKFRKNTIIVGSSKNIDKDNYGGSIWVLTLDNKGNVLMQFKITENTGGFSDTLNQLAHFGESISLCGDINGDSINDILVGAPQFNDVYKKSGASFILFLDSNGKVKKHQRFSNSVGSIGHIFNKKDLFGYGLSSIGDINGDGKIDVAIGIIGLPPLGRGGIHIYFLDGKDHRTNIPTVNTETIKLYPNPNMGTFTLGNKSIGKHSLTIYNFMGKQVLKKQYLNNKNSINTRSLSNGIYQVIIQTDKKVYQSKLIIQH